VAASAAGYVLKALTGLALLMSCVPYAIVLAAGGFSRGAAEGGPVVLFMLTGTVAALFGMALLVALVLGEWRRVITWRWAVVCLLSIAMASLCPSLLYPPLFPIVALSCLLLCGVFLGRRGTRFRSLPSVTAVVSSWRLFWRKGEGGRPRYAWKTAQSLIPLFLVGLACLSGYAAGVALKAIHAVIKVATFPFVPAVPVPQGQAVVEGALSGLMVAGIVLGICATVCLVLAAATYPWAQYQYAAVLQRFGVGLRNPGAKTSLLAVACLMLEDVPFVVEGR
jgi:hypothetical protein